MGHDEALNSAHVCLWSIIKLLPKTGKWTSILIQLVQWMHSARALYTNRSRFGDWTVLHANDEFKKITRAQKQELMNFVQCAVFSPYPPSRCVHINWMVYIYVLPINFLAIHVLPATIYACVPIAAHYTLRFLLSLLERTLRTPLAYSRNPPSEPTPQN